VPQSTTISCPVTKLDSSDAKNRATFAISCGSATRPKAIDFAFSLRSASTSKRVRPIFIISVFVIPGAIAFTFMLYFPSSKASLFVKMIKPAFAGEYATALPLVLPVVPKAELDEMLIIFPYLCFVIYEATA